MYDHSPDRPTPYLWENSTISENLMCKANEMLRRLDDPRSVEVLEMYYRDGKRLAAIGQELKITAERVRQLKNKALHRLAKEICKHDD
jgi:RNA polymerase sigma factor (sigma-70 family)